MNSENPAPIEVHLVAPSIVCWGLQRLVQTAGPPIRLAAASTTLAEAMPQLARLPADVVVIDLDDGYAMHDLTRLYERLRVKILALTSARDDALLDGLLEAGARGVLRKSEAPSALLKALEAVGEGRVYASHRAGNPEPLPPPSEAIPVAPPPAPEPNPVASLTMRERQTLGAVISDPSAPAKVIAARLCISEHTLRNHLTAIYAKFGVSGRLALYAYASEHRLDGEGFRPEARS